MGGRHAGPALGLNNLCVVVDFNRWQATGRSCEITRLEPLAEKWSAFGWRSVECDGHDPERLRDLLTAFGQEDRPTAIIAHTVKGKGVSFMEDDNNWHYRIPNAEEAQAALRNWTDEKRLCSELCGLAAHDERIALISSDIGNNLFNEFRERFPSRFMNCGIAEAAMTGIAAGMALCGLKPVTYTIASFNPGRCVEQIRLDICLHNLPVVIVGWGPDCHTPHLAPHIMRWKISRGCGPFPA